MERYYGDIAAARKARLALSRDIRQSPRAFGKAVGEQMRACREGADRLGNRDLAGLSFARGVAAMRAGAWPEAKVPVPRLSAPCPHVDPRPPP